MTKIFIKCFCDNGKDSNTFQVAKGESEKISDSMLKKLVVSQLSVTDTDFSQQCLVTGQVTLYPLPLSFSM